MLCHPAGEWQSQVNPSPQTQAGTCCATHLRESEGAEGTQVRLPGFRSGLQHQARLPTPHKGRMLAPTTEGKWVRRFTRSVLHTGPKGRPEGQPWEQSVPWPLQALCGHWALKQDDLSRSHSQERATPTVNFS